MKVLVISDINTKTNVNCAWHEELIQTIEKNFNKFKVNYVSEDMYKPCMGCFNCWIKTPGQCIIADTIREVSRDIMNFDVILLVTKVKYGCYSPGIKRILDRNIPSVLPFFKIVNGEMHHAPRYKKYPDIVVLGYGNDITSNEEITLQKLANANAINFQKKQAKTFVLKNTGESNSVILNILNYLSSIGGVN